MARNGKSISVKIATPKVIKALETALAKLESDYTAQEANEAKYEKAMEKWKKEVSKISIGAIAKAERLDANERYNGDICVDFMLPKGTVTLPEQPKRDFIVMSDWEYREKKEEMSNAIRILKMTDEEVVSTSTYNAIARYL